MNQLPQIIEVYEISEQTIQSIRVLLIQHSPNSFILVIEALKAPEYTKHEKIKPAKKIEGREKALAEMNLVVHQLRQIHYAD